MKTSRMLSAMLVLFAVIAGCSGGGSEDLISPPISPELSDYHVYRADWKEVDYPSFTPAVNSDGYVIHLQGPDRKIEDDTEVVLELDSGVQYRQKISATGEKVFFWGAPVKWGAGKLYYSFGGEIVLPHHSYTVWHDVNDVHFERDYVSLSW